jgi:hypothetical protein
MYPWCAARLVRWNRLDGIPLMVGELVENNSRFRFEGLNQARCGVINPALAPRDRCQYTGVASSFGAKPT